MSTPAACTTCQRNLAAQHPALADLLSNDQEQNVQIVLCGRCPVPGPWSE